MTSEGERNRLDQETTSDYPECPEASDDRSAACADDELSSLFSAFDQVSASDELKASTLALILGSANDPDSDDAVDQAAEKPAETATDETAETPDETATDDPKKTAPAVAPVATAGTRSLRSRLRVMRVAALAACLALALTGGVAYAVPASHVRMSQGEATIDLGINIFGMTVSATASGAESLVDTQSLKNLAGEKSMDMAAEMLEDYHALEPIDIAVESGNDDQRRRFEDHGSHIADDNAQRIREAADEQPPSPNADPQPNAFEGPAPDGQTIAAPPGQDAPEATPNWDDSPRSSFQRDDEPGSSPDTSTFAPQSNPREGDEQPDVLSQPEGDQQSDVSSHPEWVEQPRDEQSGSPEQLDSRSPGNENVNSQLSPGSPGQRQGA